MPETNSTISQDQFREELDLKIPQNVASEQIYRYWRAFINMVNKSYVNKYIDKEKAYKMMDGYAKLPDEEKYTALHDLHRLYEDMVDDFKFVRSQIILNEYKEFVTELAENIPQPFRLKFVEYMVNGQDLPEEFLAQIKDYIDTQNQIANSPKIEYKDVLSTLDKIKRTPLNASRPGFNQAFTPEQIAKLIEEDPSQIQLNDGQSDFEIPVTSKNSTISKNNLSANNSVETSDRNQDSQPPKIIYTKQKLNNSDLAPLKTVSKIDFNQPKVNLNNIKPTYFLLIWTTFNTLFKDEIVLGTQKLIIETGQNKAKAVWLNERLQARVYQLLNQKILQNNYKITTIKVYLDHVSLISYCSSFDLDKIVQDLKTYVLLTLSAELKINPQENKLWNDDFYKIELDSPQKLQQVQNYLQK